ncbi:hypothetical protein KW502_11290, partial [Mesonia sp. JHPTF-M18]|nr:hypothetical protein [Mesonia aestuariivivens]
VIGDVVNDIENEGAVYDEIIELLTSNSDVFTDLGEGKFSHTSVDGTAVDFDANTVSYTRDVNNNYVFTNANGEGVTVEVIGDVVNDIQNEGAVYDEIIELLTSNSDVFTDLGEGKFTHTSVDGTAVDFDANTVSYTRDANNNYVFTNANGLGVTVEVIGDVVNDIQNEGAVYDEILELLENNSDTFVNNNDGTFTHTSVDGTAVDFDANTVSYTRDANNNYVFTNANGLGVTVEVIGDVVNDIQNEGAVYDEIIELLENNSDQLEDIGGGIYRHITASGDTLDIDVNAVSYGATTAGGFTFTNLNGQGQTVNFTAENGLNKTYRKFKLGGNLTEATTITTTATNTLAIEGLEDGKTPPHFIVVMDDDGVLKKVTAAMPKFFYMPPILIPTSADQVPAGETYGVVDLYQKYSNQFGGTSSPALVTNPNNTGNTLPVINASKLNYYVTYYDSSVFQNVAISNNGVLTYDVINNSQVSTASFMNIVFEVK